jgi:hypothetical protein
MVIAMQLVAEEMDAKLLRVRVIHSLPRSTTVVLGLKQDSSMIMKFIQQTKSLTTVETHSSLGLWEVVDQEV